jgi:hypothetical protein
MKYQTHYRHLIDVFHSIDVGHYVELPQIAVMGDTSTGKSSLLTAISLIEFPANDNLTTRCPIRLRMEKKETTEFKVSIKWHITSKERCEWTVNTFHCTNELTAEIEKAQNCILKTRNKPVSRDIVEISAMGPDFTDITVVDLPGFSFY